MKGRFRSKYGIPITASPRTSTTGPIAGTMPPPTNPNFAKAQRAGTSAGGVRPRNWRASQLASEPMSHGEMMGGVGYPEDYRGGGKRRYVEPPAAAKRKAPSNGKGSSPFKHMTDDDFVEGAKMYRAQHGRL